MGSLRELFTSGGWTQLRFWEHILRSAKEAGLDSGTVRRFGSCRY